MDQNLMTEKFFKASQDAGASNVAQDYSENRLCNEPAGKAPWRTGLTVICIFFMLISFLGFLSAGYGLYGLFNPPKEEVAAKKSKGYQPKGRSKAGSSAKFEENFKQARDTYFPVLTYLEVMKLILALSFTVAVVMMISRSPKARVFVMGLCGVALFYHMCAIAMTFVLVNEAGGTIGQMMESSFEEARRYSGLSDEEHEEAKEFAINSIGMMLTITVAVTFLIRLLFYGAVIAYFLQAEIKPIFGEDSLEYLKAQNEGMPSPA